MIRYPAMQRGHVERKVLLAQAVMAWVAVAAFWFMLAMATPVVGRFGILWYAVPTATGTAIFVAVARRLLWARPTDPSAECGTVPQGGDRESAGRDPSRRWTPPRRPAWDDAFVGACRTGRRAVAGTRNVIKAERCRRRVRRRPA